MAIRIVAAEDSYLIREGTRLLLATQDDLELVAFVPSLPELLRAVDEHTPDVVLTDIRMPPTGTDEGIRAAEHLAVQRPGLGIVVLSQHVEPEYALRLFDGGARGRAYLLKERIADIGQLRHAIDEVTKGGSVLDPLVVDALVAARRRRASSTLARLTPRETEVLAHMARGMANTAIAAALSLSGRAVEKHVTAIMAKLDLPADDADTHRRVRAVLVYLSETSG
jgi:DNA-binding NarL/FixJ family response regulator